MNDISKIVADFMKEKVTEIESLKVELSTYREQIEREIETADHGQNCSTIGNYQCDCFISRLKEVLSRFPRKDSKWRERNNETLHRHGV